jgi:YegS/Rv2252/BmrU family lipid kinase
MNAVIEDLQKWLIIVNPKASGGKTLKQLPAVKILAAQLPYDFSFVTPESREKTTQVAEMAKSNGFDVVLAMGGDGTIADVVKGTYENGTITGVLPCGRGNDFVRNIGSHLDFKKCMSGFLNPTLANIDIGTLNGKPFLNVAGVGFDAEVVKMATEGRCRLSGTICYLINVVNALRKLRPMQLRITVDGKLYDGKFCMTGFANGGFFGGGMKFAPEAEMNDGFLDICLIDYIKPLTLLRHFPKVYKGKHTRLKIVQYFRGKTVLIEGSSDFAVQGDGDLANPLPAHIEIIPNALNIILPE